MSNTPEYLYHYTNIEALTLILQNKTFKFNSLDKMDDMQEADIQDEYRLPRFVFVSSWTDQVRESIPMWKMYTNMNSGVRIKLPSFPFQEYEQTPESIGRSALREGEALPNFKVVFPLKEIVYGLSKMPHTQDKLLVRVEYTDDHELLKPRMMTADKKGTAIDYDIVGRYKSKAWEFQEEWRYKFYVTPVSAIEYCLWGREKWQATLFQRLLSNNYALPFDAYFLLIDERAFESMEITMSPTFSAANRLILEALKDKYNPTMQIVESDLYGKLR